MNLSALERMAVEGDLSLGGLRYLLSCRGECEWLDYKIELHLERDDQTAKFARDVLAMKNVGGGFMVIGVEDKTWNPIGFSDRLTYDTKLLRDKVRRATGLELDVDIVQHQLTLAGSPRWYALIYVRSSRKRRKRRAPSLVREDFFPKEPYGLRRGEIYIRRGDQTVRLDRQDELEDLLADLEDRADRDSLRAAGATSPFAVEIGTYRLLDKDFDTFIGRDDLRNELLDALRSDPRIWIVNVHGPGGVGKSALASWAAYELYETGYFEAIIQLTAKETMLTELGIFRTQTRSLYSLEDLLDQIAIVFEETPPPELDAKKKLAVNILSVWKTLLVLDNMETVQDARILSFVQSLPSENIAKVLLTSRQKSGGWERPIYLPELTGREIEKFVAIKSAELESPLPRTAEILSNIERVSGGLPLAIQWIIGRFKSTGDLKAVLDSLKEPDSPVLEFSFGNIWKILSHDAKAILVVLSIFDEPPAIEQIAIATGWTHERIERALVDLEDVTLVRRVIHDSDGRVIFAALPITLSFVRHHMYEMGDFETQCRRRLQLYTQQMELRDWEMQRFASVFGKYQIRTDTEKRAAILCRRGESETFAGNLEQAGALFRQARELAPGSAYVLAMSASYELSRGRLGLALEFANDACQRSTRITGSLCYTTKARVLDRQHDKAGRLAALEKAIEYDPDDLFTRHQYGVALSRTARTQDAVEQFDYIIDRELSRSRPTETLIMALKTRILNLRRLGLAERATEDLRLAEDLLARYPELQAQAFHIAQLEEDG
jgi:tetratricopeptide (TPR) repeat protein